MENTNVNVTNVNATDVELEKKLDEAIPEKIKTQAAIYDDEIEALQKDLELVEDDSVLAKMEEDIGKLIDENNEKQSKKKYPLQEDVVFRGTKYTRSAVGSYIVKFLESHEVGWQMSLGMFDLISFWKGKNDIPDEIPFEYYDATLRLLGQLKYKGLESLRNILVINAFFAPTHDQYINDLSYTYYLANKHSAIIDRRDAIAALNTPVGKK